MVGVTLIMGLLTINGRTVDAAHTALQRAAQVRLGTMIGGSVRGTLKHAIKTGGGDVTGHLAHLNSSASHLASRDHAIGHSVSGAVSVDSAHLLPESLHHVESTASGSLRHLPSTSLERTGASSTAELHRAPYNGGSELLGFKPLNPELLNQFKSSPLRSTLEFSPLQATVFTKEGCDYCAKAKELLHQSQIPYRVVEPLKNPQAMELYHGLLAAQGDTRRTFPKIIIHTPEDPIYVESYEQLVPTVKTTKLMTEIMSELQETSPELLGKMNQSMVLGQPLDPELLSLGKKIIEKNPEFVEKVREIFPLRDPSAGVLSARALTKE